MPVSSLVTAVGVWLWDKYGETVTDKVAGAAKDKWSEFKWKDAAEKYRAKIKKLYGTTQIMGMAEPVPLDDIFTDVYMLDKPTAFGRFDIERLKQLSADPDAPPPHAERINGLRIVRGKGNLFILGKPGAGKTTFLKYIALQAAEQNIDKIPIFVTLKHWTDSGLDLMPFIAGRFDICDFPDARPFVEELLKSGRAPRGLTLTFRESGSNLAVVLDSALAHLYALARNRIADTDRVSALANARDEASDFARDLGLNKLARALDALSIPTDKASVARQQRFADKLQRLMIEHREIGQEWNLTQVQERRLADYLNANRLLQDCLELACMPPGEKRAVLNSLYLPSARSIDVLGAGDD